MRAYDKKRRITDMEFEGLYKLIEENLGDELNTNDDAKKRQIIIRVRNALIRNGCFNRMDICEAKDLDKCTGLGGKLGKTVIANIKGDYDERKAKEERLAEIDQLINMLLNEKVQILKSLD